MQHSHFCVKKGEGTKLQGKQTETKPGKWQEKIILCLILPYRIGFTHFKNNSAEKCRADFSTQASRISVEYTCVQQHEWPTSKFPSQLSLLLLHPTRVWASHRDPYSLKPGGWRPLSQTAGWNPSTADQVLTLPFPEPASRRNSRNAGLQRREAPREGAAAPPRSGGSRSRAAPAPGIPVWSPSLPFHALTTHGSSGQALWHSVCKERLVTAS